MGGRELLDYFDEIGTGWTSWSVSDHPRLADDEWVPTAFGELVREAFTHLLFFVLAAQAPVLFPLEHAARDLRTVAEVLLFASIAS